MLARLGRGDGRGEMVGLFLILLEVAALEPGCASM